jgi:hypothetical protein
LDQETGLAQEKCERRSTAETPKGFLHVRLQGSPGKGGVAGKMVFDSNLLA